MEDQLVGADAERGIRRERRIGLPLSIRRSLGNPLRRGEAAFEKLDL